MKFLILVWCFVLMFYKSSAYIKSSGCDIRPLLQDQQTAIILRPLGTDFIISDIKTNENILQNGRIFVNCEAFRYQKARPRWYRRSVDYDYFTDSPSEEEKPSIIMVVEDMATEKSPLVESEIKSVELFCDFGRLTLTSENESPKILDSGSKIQCDNELSFYKVQSAYCTHQSLTLGLDIKGFPVSFAEVCYDFDNKKVAYLHYTTGKRSSFLHKQVDHNPNSANASEMIGENKFSFDQQYDFNITIQNDLTMYKSLMKFIDYELSELVASSNFFTILKHLQPENKLPLVPWWKSLKHGNWKIYEELLQMHTHNQNFSVFTGISHIARYPEKFLCSINADITYKINSEDNNIPQYIWSYVKMRNETSDQYDVVVIGINTPFFNSSQILCTDICSDITWLAELEVTRKMPTFGYIFCCEPDEVRTILDGFPRKSVTRTE